MKNLEIEGVRYYRYRVRYTLANGTHRQMFRWAPAMIWLRESVGRELFERFGLEGIKAGSVKLSEAHAH